MKDGVNEAGTRDTPSASVPQFLHLQKAVVKLGPPLSRGPQYGPDERGRSVEATPCYLCRAEVTGVPLPHTPSPGIYRFLIVLHKGLLGEEAGG